MNLETAVLAGYARQLGCSRAPTGYLRGCWTAVLREHSIPGDVQGTDLAR